MFLLNSNWRKTKQKSCLSVCLALVASFFLFLSFSLSVFALGDTSFPYGNDGWIVDAETDPWKILNEVSLQDGEGHLNILSRIFGLEDNIAWGPDTAVNYVVRLINIALWLVSFIALVYLIYTFYKMFFVKTEDGLTSARKAITGLFIAIFIIGLSRVVVWYLFSIRDIIKG